MEFDSTVFQSSVRSQNRLSQSGSFSFIGRYDSSDEMLPGTAGTETTLFFMSPSASLWYICIISITSLSFCARISRAGLANCPDKSVMQVEKWLQYFSLLRKSCKFCENRPIIALYRWKLSKRHRAQSMSGRALMCRIIDYWWSDKNGAVHVWTGWSFMKPHVLQMPNNLVITHQ
jgi:hypothetical protein